MGKRSDDYLQNRRMGKMKNFALEKKKLLGLAICQWEKKRENMKK